MRHIALFLLVFCSFAVKAQDSLGTHIDYVLTTEAAIGTGDNTAYQLVTNRHHILGTRNNTAYMRGAVILKHNISDKLCIEGVADVAGSLHADHKVYLQQCYANVKYGDFFAEIGSREIEPVLRNFALSSGAFVESGNAKPIPQIRIGTNGFWTVPGTKKWLEIYVDGGYGHYLDADYLNDAYDAWHKTHELGHVTTDVWYHHKQLYFRSNPTKRVFVTAGGTHDVQFGGKYEGSDPGVANFQSDLTPKFKDFFNVLIPKSESSTGQWISGNHLGMMTVQVSWNIDKKHQLSAYLDDIFEDGSGMRKGNGYDGLWGLEYKNNAEGVQYVRGVVAEYLQTTHQSGYVHLDCEDFSEPYASLMPYLITGNDEYYNNYFYNGYAHYGMAQGNALLMSPRYNPDGYLGFTENAVKAYHLAVQGDIAKGRTGDFYYLLKGSYREGYGTHHVPMRHHSFDVMAQIGWQKGTWHSTLSYGLDKGNIYGDNSTIDLKISYHGKIL